MYRSIKKGGYKVLWTYFGLALMPISILIVGMSSAPGHQAPMDIRIPGPETKLEHVLPDEPGHDELRPDPNADGSRVIAEGTASYYGRGFAGRPTANGEIFDPNALTAAHRTLPFGTKILVTNKRNGKQVVVRVNDRGPFIKDRIVDLSEAAAREIGMIRSGTARVRLERV